MVDELELRGDEGLSPALTHFCQEWSRRTGVEVEIWALPSGEVPKEIARAVLAVVREALGRVELGRGRSPRAVSLAITLGRTGLRLTVSDDGDGRTSAAHKMSAVRMRALFAERGGSLTVNDVLGGGTTVSGTLPVG
ncbi:hypothetical protein [Spongiactinospora sp. TRM90649]|uniref:hypothetical protein n=1 Tax=Spongiactinospora sp. TRM90649 TaxID=3031114 RepID=UPI0023FA098D|nr:hypothetical protein [Spongiactinospora sp. TRM90649]MDF5757804.1 hypothetical protein [Spongiactinospora sp. TRM90649]